MRARNTCGVRPTPGGSGFGIAKSAATMRTLQARPRRRILIAESAEDGTSGGSHRCLHDIAVHLDTARFEPVCLFYRDNRVARRLASAGIEVHDWTELRARERGDLERAGGFLARAAVRAGIVSRRAAFLRRARIDLVHANNSPNVCDLDWLPASLATGVPLVSHARGPIARPEHGSLALMYRGFRRVIAVSRTVRADVVAAGFPASRTELLYDGIDLAALRRAAAVPHVPLRRTLGIPDEDVIAVMVGHLQTWKGQDVAIEALRLVASAGRRVHLVLVGGAPEEPGVSERRLHDLVAAAQLGDRVHFLGEREDVPAIVSDADMLVHASVIPEPLGLVVLEGMALGVPVIASMLGGPSETVTDGAGLLFDPANPAALAAQMQRVIEDRALRTSLVRRELERANDFDIAGHVHRLQGIYETVLAPSREQARASAPAAMQQREARA